MEFEKIIKTAPPFDKRDPNPSKNYGIGSLRLWFILKKGEKATQVLISTNSYLNHNQIELNKKHNSLMDGDYEGYSCWDVGYHSDIPTYEDQTDCACNLSKSGRCYYDGSSLRGKNDNIAENYIKNGDEWVWEYLEKEWNVLFGDN